MAKEVIMPKFGFTQETADLVAWLKKEGDTVEIGDPIAEVTTDKVNMEVEAPESGILAGLQYKVGDTVPVTKVIAYILKPGESLPQTTSTPPSTPRPISPVSEVTHTQMLSNITPLAKRVAQDLSVDLQQVVGSGIGGRLTRRDVEAYARAQFPSTEKLRATPSARRISRAENVDLHQVQGTGPRGRIQGTDVIQFIGSKPSPQTAPLQETTLSEDGIPADVIPMTSIRRTIAQRLQSSFQQSPHIFLEADVDVTALDALRVRANNMPQAKSIKVSLTALITRITAWALKQNPYINSGLDENNILLFKEINIGIAVALENGLIVPVLRNADMKTVFEIATETAALVERARSNTLRLEDLARGTFTISNLGMFDVDRFTAIINPPQSAILAIGRSFKRFVPDENNQPVVRSLMTVTLSADHRIIDGAVAARFLSDLRGGIEHPEMIIL